MWPARVLMVRGAEVLLVPNACGIHFALLHQLRSRAYENAFAVTMCNYAHPTQNGNSVGFNHLGDVLVHANGDVGVYIASIDINAQRKYRTTGTANAFMDPKPHVELCSFDRIKEFPMQNVLHRVGGSTI